MPINKGHDEAAITGTDLETLEKLLSVIGCIPIY